MCVISEIASFMFANFCVILIQEPQGDEWLSASVSTSQHGAPMSSKNYCRNNEAITPSRSCSGPGYLELRAQCNFEKWYAHSLKTGCVMSTTSLLGSNVALSFIFRQVSNGTMLYTQGPQFWRSLCWHTFPYHHWIPSDLNRSAFLACIHSA